MDVETATAAGAFQADDEGSIPFTRSNLSKRLEGGQFRSTRIEDGVMRLSAEQLSARPLLGTRCVPRCGASEGRTMAAVETARARLARATARRATPKRRTSPRHHDSGGQSSLEGAWAVDRATPLQKRTYNLQRTLDTMPSASSRSSSTS
jgi:hypothetical protein